MTNKEAGLKVVNRFIGIQFALFVIGFIFSRFEYHQLAIIFFILTIAVFGFVLRMLYEIRKS